MELNGEQLIGAPREKVWQALNDPDILRRCIPGCEEIQKVSDTELHTRVMVKMGPVRARFSGKLIMQDVRPPGECTLVFEGAGGAAGFAKGRSGVTLSEQDGKTRLAYAVDATVGGKLGQIGGRLIDSSAKKMADEFFAQLQQALSGETPASAGGQAMDQNPGVQPVHAQAGGAPPSGEDAAGKPPSSAFGPHQKPAFAGGFGQELYRVFWFALGVAFTLLVSRWPA